MPFGPSRKPFAAFVLLATLAVLSAVRTSGRGQPPGGSIDRKAGQGPTRTFISAKDCPARCHRPPGEGYEPLFVGDPNQPRLVRFDEAKVWSELDKHSRAYDAMTGRRGQVMGKLLGYKDVKTERACLSCHATGFLPDDDVDVRAEALKSVDQGVNCAACHGSYLDWVEKHGLTADQARRWRLKSPEEKSKQFGMTNLRDPATKAGVCYSCHVGNAGERKVVTHAMYAAGHPPLPGVEVATFLDAMPRHWWKPSEVEAFHKDAGLRERNHIDLAEPRGTKMAVVGGAVALRDAMRLLAARAEPEPTPLGREGKTWPDYALLECYACHHDLQASGGRRQRQARGGAPGRPRFRPWPLALSGLALAQTDGENRIAFEDAVKDLDAVFDARPFGDPSDVTRAARKLESWSDTVLRALQSTRFDASTPPKMLAALVANRDAGAADYDSARQIARAFKAIYDDWRPRPANHDQFSNVMAELDRALKLDPFASREPRAKLVRAEKHPSDPLREALLVLSEEEFKVSISRAADYDPAAFHSALERLAKLLDEAKVSRAPAQ